MKNKQLYPFHSKKSGISLNACRNVKIQDDEIVGNVLGNIISLENINKKELTISKQSFFRIIKLNHFKK